MEKIYDGKTKAVYRLDNGNVRLFFKDDVTGTDGVFDPGANTVGLSIKDNGYYGLLMSKYFFELFEQNGIKTHYLSANLQERTMDVCPVTMLGQGIEVICRYIATGSFTRRYGAYMADGTPMNAYVEISLKDDDRGDPFISQELLELFGILQAGEYDQLVQMTRDISNLIKQDLAQKEIILYDLKLEFGKNAAGELILIDEVSGGNMRAKHQGKSVAPIELSKMITE